MFIQPITSIIPISSIAPISSQKAEALDGSGNQIPFKSIFTDALNNVKETDQNLQSEIQKVVMGETDDLHSVGIASTKAGLAVDLVIQLRNKALDSYNEIMRMGV